MNTPFLRRWLPPLRLQGVVAALLALVAGLLIALSWIPQVRQRAAAALGYPAAASPSDTDRGQAQEASDADHRHDGEESGETGHDHGKEADEPDGHDGHDHEGHGHEGEAAASSRAAGHKHDEAASVNLSAEAQKNVGLRLEKIELKSFQRTIAIPAMIVERPGRTKIQVAAPLTGMILRVWPMQGETVTPGQPLFDLRLTHEEVVEAQAEFLRTAEELDVLEREIGRLEKVAAEGAIAGKTLLERKYEKRKLLAVERSQRQRLLLHGLTARQVDDILAKRTLLSQFTVFAPDQPEEGTAVATKGDGPNTSAKKSGQSPQKPAQPPLLQVQELKVEKGQHVKAGDLLCVLSDHSELFIQGKAFEQDAPALDKAADNDWPIAAVIDANGRDRQIVPGLPLLYAANQVEPESRAFLFYVQLPNKLIRNRRTADGHRFSAWQFKPGQRVELLVPVEQWKNRIVLPVGAVVQDGAESYVFEQNNGHFDRRTVHVEYRDQFSAVVANDNALTIGKMIIASGAYQVHLAMKNKAGGAPDPHAGHNH
jgi:membrane fusion protein, heavy metal efflux system